MLPDSINAPNRPLKTALAACERMEMAVARQQEIGMRMLAAIAGNPEGAAVTVVPGATAFLTKAARASHQMNHICVTGPEWVHSAESLLNMYIEPGIVPHVKIPEMLMPTLDAVKKLGWQVQKVQQEIRFCGAPLATHPMHPQHMVIREVADVDDLDSWLELHMEAFVGQVRKRDDTSAPGPDWSHWRAFHGAPGRRHFLAFVDGEPAAQAGMYCHAGIAYLGPAATLPRFRRQGLHGALLLERMHQAYLASCNLVTCGADIGSVSALNQERSGLKAAYVREFLNLVKCT